MARGLFFLSRTRKLPCGREPGKRLGIFIDEFEQTSSRRIKLNNRCTHVVGDIGELWLSRHNISHHGAERRSKRASIGRATAAARHSGIGSQRIDKFSIHHRSILNKPKDRPAAHSQTSSK